VLLSLLFFFKNKNNQTLTMSIPPIDVRKFDQWVRDVYFVVDSETGAVDATKFFNAFQRLDIEFLEEDHTQTRQIFSPQMAPLDRVLEWSGFQNDARETYTVNEDSSCTPSVSELEQHYTGDITIVMTNLLPLLESDMVNDEELLLRVTVTLNPGDVIPNEYGSTTVIDVLDPVRENVGYIKVIGIPPLVYYDYTYYVNETFTSLDADSVLAIDVQYAEGTPNMTRSWVGVRRALLADPDSEMATYGALPPSPPAETTAPHEWVLKGYVNHAPFQNTSHQIPTPIAEGEIRRAVMNWPLASVPPAIYEVFVFDSTNKTYERASTDPVAKFHSRQSTRPSTFDVDRVLNNRTTGMTAYCTAESSANYTIGARIVFDETSASWINSRVQVRLDPNSPVLAWSPVPPSTAIRTVGDVVDISVETLTGVDHETGAHIGLKPDYYRIEHIGDDGSVHASAEIYSALSIPL
jgi:hypothetical protein